MLGNDGAGAKLFASTRLNLTIKLLNFTLNLRNLT